MKEKKYIEISYKEILVALAIIIAITFWIKSIFVHAEPLLGSTNIRPQNGAYLEYNGNYLSLKTNTFVLYQGTNFAFAGTSDGFFTKSSTYPVLLQGSSDILNGNRTSPSLNYIDKIYCNDVSVLPDDLRSIALPLSSCPLYHLSISVDSQSTAVVYNIKDGYFTAIIHLPAYSDSDNNFTYVNPNNVDINYNVLFSLPSDSFVTALMTDFNNLQNGVTTKPLVDDDYKRTYVQSAFPTSYTKKLSDLEEYAPAEHNGFQGSHYYVKLPYSFYEVSHNALNHAGMSSINNYPNQIGYLLKYGYISRCETYAIFDNTQTVVHYIMFYPNGSSAGFFYVDKQQSDITSSDINEETTAAWREESWRLSQEDMQRYVYNPNIEAGQNIASKVDSLVTTVTGLIGTVSGIGVMFGLFFSCLPTFVIDIISFTIVSLCIISIYKALRG